MTKTLGVLINALINIPSWLCVIKN